MQPPSLKSAAFEIGFRMCNKEKLRWNLVSSCSPIEKLEFAFVSDWATSHQQLREGCSSRYSGFAGFDAAAALQGLLPG